MWTINCLNIILSIVWLSTVLSDQIVSKYLSAIYDHSYLGICKTRFKFLEHKRDTIIMYEIQIELVILNYFRHWKIIIHSYLLGIYDDALWENNATLFLHRIVILCLFRRQDWLLLYRKLFFQGYFQEARLGATSGPVPTPGGFSPVLTAAKTISLRDTSCAEGLWKMPHKGENNDFKPKESLIWLSTPTNAALD